MQRSLGALGTNGGVGGSLGDPCPEAPGRGDASLSAARSMIDGSSEVEERGLPRWGLANR
jgi:hypothetical protein